MQQLKVTKELDVSGAAVLGWGGFTMPTGHASGDKNKFYFVSEDWGNDGNNGKSWKNAFASFEKGIDAARYDAGTTDIADDKGHRAYVFVAPGHYNETTELLFSGYNISVIGCGIGVPGKDYGVSLNYDGSASATAAFLFSGSGIEVHNLHIYCDAAIPAVYIAGGDNNWLNNCVIECDGTNCTYGIQAASMKGSWITNCVVNGAKTAGIWVEGGDGHYFITGGIRNNIVYSGTSNTTGILVDATNVCYGSLIDHNFVELRTGSSAKGIDVNATSGVLVTDNYVSVPSSATPIEHAGGEQYLMGNHTAAGTTNVDPNPAAG